MYGDAVEALVAEVVEVEADLHRAILHVVERVPERSGAFDGCGEPDALELLADVVTIDDGVGAGRGVQRPPPGVGQRRGAERAVLGRKVGQVVPGVEQVVRAHRPAPGEAVGFHDGFAVVPGRVLPHERYWVL